MKKGEAMEEWTDRMSIEIDNIPRDKVTEIANLIGNILISENLKFDYGGIGEEFTDNICGIEFEIKNS